MAAPSIQATALATRITPGTAQPSLTGEIERCDCSGEVRAGLFFLNGDWDLAHRAAQGLDSANGAYWHALVHRQEGDFSNSRYWMHRVGDSPLFPLLVEVAGREGEEAGVVPRGRWDPARFTDFYADPSHHHWTRRVERREMKALLELCLRP